MRLFADARFLVPSASGLISFSFSAFRSTSFSLPSSFACSRNFVTNGRNHSSDDASSTTSTAFTVLMAQVHKDGSSKVSDYSLDELLGFLRREKLTLPPRDLKIFFRSNLEAAASTCVMARPKAKCFLLELEHLKVICLHDKCLVLHPDAPVVR